MEEDDEGREEAENWDKLSLFTLLLVTRLRLVIGVVSEMEVSDTEFIEVSD